MGAHNWRGGEEEGVRSTPTPVVSGTAVCLFGEKLHKIFLRGNGSCPGPFFLVMSGVP